MAAPGRAADRRQQAPSGLRRAPGRTPHPGRHRPGCARCRVPWRHSSPACPPGSPLPRSVSRPASRRTVAAASGSSRTAAPPVPPRRAPPAPQPHHGDTRDPAGSRTAAQSTAVKSRPAAEAAIRADPMQGHPADRAADDIATVGPLADHDSPRGERSFTFRLIRSATAGPGSSWGVPTTPEVADLRPGARGGPCSRQPLIVGYQRPARSADRAA